MVHYANEDVFNSSLKQSVLHEDQQGIFLTRTLWYKGTNDFLIEKIIDAVCNRKLVTQMLKSNMPIKNFTRTIDLMTCREGGTKIHLVIEYETKFRIPQLWKGYGDEISKYHVNFLADFKAFLEEGLGEKPLKGLGDTKLEKVH